jgi:hypothetical protein
LLTPYLITEQEIDEIKKERKKEKNKYHWNFLNYLLFFTIQNENTILFIQFFCNTDNNTSAISATIFEKIYLKIKEYKCWYDQGLST